MAKLGRIVQGGDVVALSRHRAATVTLLSIPTPDMRAALESFEGSVMFPGNGLQSIWDALLEAAAKEGKLLQG